MNVAGDDVVHLNTKYFFKSNPPANVPVRPISEILNQLATTFVLSPSNGVSVAGNEINAQQSWADKTFFSNPELNGFLSTTFDQNQLTDPDHPKSFLIWLFFSEKEFKFIPEASGLLQATDADQLGDLGIMDLKMPVNGFLYVYVANESTQFVDFDHLTIIHQGGRVMEENHYYPYGMLMEGLSFSSAGAPNDYKFNGVQYETGNDLYNYLATFRNYDPAIAKWNQLDPMNQFYNGYFAYGGNPVSLADPLGLSVNYTRGGNGGSDAPTYQDRRDLWDKGMIGGGGFISASGGHYTFESLRAEGEIARFYNTFPDDMKAELGNLGAYEFAAGVNAGEMSVNIATTTPEVFAYSSATYMGCDNNPQMYNDNGIIYFASIHTYSFSGEGGGKWDNSNLALDIGGGIYGALESASRTGDKWLGLNGKYYNNKWQGNQHTGGRSGAFKAASSYKWAGRAVVGVSAIIGVAATYDGYQMDGGQFGYNAQSAAAQTVGGIGGSIGGAALGAQIGGAFGALFGGVGAIPGAVIGGFIGGYFGGALGNSAGQATVNLYHHK